MEHHRTPCDHRRLTFAEYMSFQRALMRRFVANGGTEAEFCARIAPAFRRRYGALLFRS